MKKRNAIWSIIVGLVTLAAGTIDLIRAGVIFSGRIVDEAGLTYNANYSVDLASAGITQLSAQVDISSVIVTGAAKTFTTGSQSTTTITVASFTALSETRSYGSITVASNTAVTGSYAFNQLSVMPYTELQFSTNAAIVRLGTNVVVGISDGVRVSSFQAGVQWQIENTSTGTAVNLAKLLNGALYGISASTTGTGSTITLTATQYGTSYNNYQLFSSYNSTITVNQVNFVGGTDPAWFSVNGIRFNNPSEWTTATTATGTAVNIRDAINAKSALTAILNVTTGTSGRVDIYAVSSGTAYTYSLETSSQTALTITGVSSTWSGSTFTASGITGGINNAQLIIAGYPLRQGTHFSNATSSAATAKSISDAIMAHATLSQVLRSTWVNNVIYATSTADGSLTNFSLFSSTQAALQLAQSASVNSVGASTSVMTGGTDLGYSIGTDLITVTSHGLTLGFPVLYSTGGLTITGLVNQTTYYVIPASANTLYLARTSTDATSNSYINLDSTSTQVSAITFTLTPLAVTGFPGVSWQVSNDGTTWFNHSASSTTMLAPYTSTSTYVDLGRVNARYIRAKVTAPTAGAANIKVTINASN